MKFFVLILIIFLSHCSFDNKTGIWENSNKASKTKESKFKDFKTIYAIEESFNKKILPNKNLKITINPPKTNLIWQDEFYNNTNNLENFSYKNKNEIVFKSKKLSKYKVKKNILFDGENLVLSDEKGNIIVYSIEDLQIIHKFNFYKNRFKNIKKKINFIINDNIIYVADNIGYIYAVDYKNKKIVWAKNYKVPFRSNLKIKNNLIFLADQNNLMYIIDKSNGDKINTLPTEETILKNEFINSFAVDKESIFFLNTFGTLYSLNTNSLKINWFLNLNQSLDNNVNNLFYSNKIVIKDKRIIVSTDPYLYILNFENGSTISKKLITSISRPIVTKEGLFLITKDNLLVYKDLNTFKVAFSISINEQIAKFLETKKKSIRIKSFSIIDDKIYLFLENSYLVKFTLTGEIQQIDKLPIKLGSFPIFINKSILYLSNNNKLVILN